MLNTGGGVRGGGGGGGQGAHAPCLVDIEAIFTFFYSATQKCLLLLGEGSPVPNFPLENSLQGWFREGSRDVTIVPLAWKSFVKYILPTFRAYSGCAVPASLTNFKPYPDPSMLCLSFLCPSPPPAPSEFHHSEHVQIFCCVIVTLLTTCFLVSPLTTYVLVSLLATCANSKRVLLRNHKLG